LIAPNWGRPRVVYLAHVARLSGAELALLRLLPVLTAVDPYVILAEPGPLRDELLAAGIAVELLPMAAGVRDLRRDRVRPGAVGLRSLIAAAGYTLQLRRRLRQLRPDLVHTNSLKAAVYGGVAGKLAGVPVIWHVRDRISADYLPAPAVRLVNALGRVLPAGLIANSQATLDVFAPRTCLPNTVLHDPVVLPAARAPRQPGEPLRVGLLGRIAPWKGQDVFLRAFARAFPSEPAGRSGGSGGARAVLIGAPLFGETAYADELRRLADELGVTSRVEFTGFRADIDPVLADLDVLVHASVIPEPFGQVVIEGMAAGLPVLAADAGGPREVVRHDVDGLLYPMGEVDSLADALRRIADDPELRHRLGKAGRARAADFSLESAAAQVTDFYRRLLSGAPSRVTARKASSDGLGVQS
jgi:glycosyltransferase involved in cell wall biosynthesis